MCRPTCYTLDQCSTRKCYCFEICLACFWSRLTLPTLSELVTTETDEFLLFSDQRSVLDSAADFLNKQIVQPQMVNNLRLPNHLFSFIKLDLETCLEVRTRPPAVSPSLSAYRDAMPSPRGDLFNLNVA